MLMLLWLRTLLTRSNRQRSQGLVEWSLMAASLAFVGVVGFNAVATGEHDYLANLPTNPVAPSAPGSLMHPTAVTIGSGCPSTSKLGVTITCTATVTDMYGNPADLNPPWGTINWYLTAVGQPAGPPIYSCWLPHLTTGSTNTCTMTWMPTSSTNATGSYTLLAKYEAPESNHYPSQSSLGLLLTANLMWTTGCVNDLLGGSPPATSVEIGHPLRCTVTLADGSAGAGFVTVPKNTQIDWSSANYAGGTPNFTCATTSVVGGVLQTAGQPCNNAGTSYSCLTDSGGTCSVVYRHLYDSSGGGIGANPALTLAASTYGIGAASPPLYLSITRTPDQHPTGIVVLCDNADSPAGHLKVFQFNLGDKGDSSSHYPGATFGNAWFGGTTSAANPGGSPPGTYGGTKDLDVFGTPHGTNVACAVWVYDSVNGGANNPAVSSSPNPNLQESFPPSGVVTVSFSANGGPAVPITGAQCTLTPVAAATQPVQSGTQAPFFSFCPVNISIGGGSVGGPQEYIVVSYSGEATSNPAHSAPVTEVPCEDDFNVQIPGYRFNVDFF
jgi:hypothetical protein